MDNAATGLEIAIIGMAGRFPGARSVHEFWQNLQHGVESITFFSDEDLLNRGVDEQLLNDPHYVKAGGVLADADQFDASFFGYNPREAELLDPQHRLFLECAWEALETAGYNPHHYRGLIGVFGGAGMNGYLLNLYANEQIRHTVSPYELFLANDKDFLATRVSYKLNLEGPSLTVQTACSSSLVAVHSACQSLLSGECDMALAGGVAVSRQMGYRYQEGGIYAPDGHCRAFDARAQGTVGGNGVGIVVLKRLADALTDGDTIEAVIKGSAINNDGGAKVSYTAPRIDSQAAVIQAAHLMAEVSPETITYIEAHGTGTALGDPIELAALTQVFRPATDQVGFCGIGSVKTNIGHLDAAAGIASLIKTVLALKHRQLPASLHFERLNPQIDLASSPFYVNASLADWNADQPRRAGVSSFGIGGTNAHVIVEEAPSHQAGVQAQPPVHLLVLSARTETALETMTANLADHLEQNSDLDLADVAYTLQVGRQAFDQRRLLVCEHQSVSEAIDGLRASQSSTANLADEPRAIAFMFPGQGSQYPGMTRQLYERQPVFKQAIEHCATILDAELDVPLVDLLYADAASERLTQTAYTQPALFAVEYALAQLWMSWGIRPEAAIGHSLGEYVAACLAGVFSLEEGIKLVATRGRLMQQMPTGAMLAVALSAEAVQPWLQDGVGLAALNAPEWSVVAGTLAAMDTLEKRLATTGITCRRLATSHAFHSPLMDPMLQAFDAALQQVTLHPPRLPFLSNVTGAWIRPEEATDPHYWVQHARQPVQFAAGVNALQHDHEHILLEVGLGATLGTLTQAIRPRAAATTILTSLPQPHDTASEERHVLNTLGQLWLHGAHVDWTALYPDAPRQRLPLPTYPFERQRYWVDPDANLPAPARPDSKLDFTDWFYTPSWQRDIACPPSSHAPDQRDCWLVFGDTTSIGAGLAHRLEHSGQDVFTVAVGDTWTQTGYRQFVINPRQPQDYRALLEDLQVREWFPTRVVHLWSLNTVDTTPTDFDQIQQQGFYSLLFLGQALAVHPSQEALSLTVVTHSLYDVLGNETLQPAQATVQGICQVLGQEYPHIGCRLVDIIRPDAQPDRLVAQLWAELTTIPNAAVIAYRGPHRWRQTYQPLPPPSRPSGQLRPRGTYAIVGDLDAGLGGFLAASLKQHFQANVVLMRDLSSSSTDLPAQSAAALSLDVDITHVESLRDAVANAEAQLGPLHGVFYSTPTTNEQAAAPLVLLQPSQCEYNFHSKVHGLVNLAAALAGKSLDFCCVQSSMSAVIGGVGLAAYAGANSFVDAFVQQQNQVSEIPWYSVNWDACLPDDASPPTGFGAAMTEFALTPQQVWEASRYLLEAGYPTQVVVSKSDLDARIQQWARFTPQTPEGSPTATRPRIHARPPLVTAHVAPSNDIEHTLATIWQDLLGLEQVGVNDSFFDLGGHSLLAIQAISRLREAFPPVELEMRSLLFETPTIAGIAAIIADSLPKPDELNAMAEVLAEVRNLSPEEVRQQLATNS